MWTLQEGLGIIWCPDFQPDRGDETSNVSMYLAIYSLGLRVQGLGL